MWNAKITTLAEKPELEQTVAEAKSLQIRELENWLNLQVPSLKFANLRSQTIKEKGLDVELDEIYHVQIVKQGERVTVTTQTINTFVNEEDELLAQEEAEEAESLNQPNVMDTLGVNVTAMTAEQAIKAINSLTDASQLEALKAEEEANKNRSTVIAAITDRLEDLQTQP